MVLILGLGTDSPSSIFHISTDSNPKMIIQDTSSFESYHKSLILEMLIMKIW